MRGISAFSGINRQFMKVISDINQRYTKVDIQQPTRTDVLALSPKKTDEEQRMRNKPSSENETYRPAPSVQRRGGYGASFDLITQKADYLHWDNADYTREIKNRLALSEDKSLSESDRNINRQAAQSLKERFLDNLEGFQNQIRETVASYGENPESIISDFGRSVDGLSGLRNKSIDEIYDAVEGVVGVMRGYTEQLQEAHFEKYGEKLERQTPYLDERRRISMDNEVGYVLSSLVEKVGGTVTIPVRQREDDSVVTMSMEYALWDDKKATSNTPDTSFDPEKVNQQNIEQVNSMFNKEESDRLNVWEFNDYFNEEAYKSGGASHVSFTTK